MADRKYTAAQVIGAMKGSGGIKAVIAQRLGCHRHTVTNYIMKYPTVRDAWLDERLNFRDAAESELAKKVKAGDWKAISFALTHLDDEGIIRPPTQKREIDHSGEGLKVSINWAEIKPEDDIE